MQANNIVMLENDKAVLLPGHGCCNCLITIITGHRPTKRCPRESPAFQTHVSPHLLYSISHGSSWQPVNYPCQWYLLSESEGLWAWGVGSIHIVLTPANSVDPTTSLSFERSILRTQKCLCLQAQEWQFYKWVTPGDGEKSPSCYNRYSSQSTVF